MARDLFYDAAKNALIKDGWRITDDPFSLKVGDSELYIDLGAERLIAAERNSEKIAVEVKSFIGNSSLSDFHLAVGQFINSPYAEVAKTLTPSPSPIKGEGNKKILNFIFAPLLPSWEKGVRGIFALRKMGHQL